MSHEITRKKAVAVATLVLLICAAMLAVGSGAAAQVHQHNVVLHNQPDTGSDYPRLYSDHPDGCSVTTLRAEGETQKEQVARHAAWIRLHPHVHIIDAGRVVAFTDGRVILYVIDGVPIDRLAPVPPDDTQAAAGSPPRPELIFEPLVVVPPGDIPPVFHPSLGLRAALESERAKSKGVTGNAPLNPYPPGTANTPGWMDMTSP